LAVALTLSALILRRNRKEIDGVSLAVEDVKRYNSWEAFLVLMGRWRSYLRFFSKERVRSRYIKSLSIYNPHDKNWS
jgi:hypothetical protein